MLYSEHQILAMQNDSKWPMTLFETTFQLLLSSCWILIANVTLNKLHTMMQSLLPIQSTAPPPICSLNSSSPSSQQNPSRHEMWLAGESYLKASRNRSIWRFHHAFQNAQNTTKGPRWTSAGTKGATIWTGQNIDSSIVQLTIYIFFCSARKPWNITDVLMGRHHCQLCSVMSIAPMLPLMAVFGPQLAAQRLINLSHRPRLAIFEA